MESCRTLLIEGWRYIPHSYAVVNQFQCLELLKMHGLRIVHRDIPYYGTHWQTVKGLFSPEKDEAIRSIPTVADDTGADAILRITFPYNYAPSKLKRTYVYGTAEFRCVPKDYILQRRPLGELMAESDIFILTPSQWSRDGFVESGGDPKRIAVVPHGVDPSIYHPLTGSERDALRDQIGCRGFTFLTVGAMTWNKGLPLLLKAFAEVAQKHPRVWLTVKGLDTLYPSRDSFLKETKELSQTEARVVQERLTYIGQTLNFEDMARLYQTADAYVSPYFAEGFNMPCLEAAACGAVVICTQGGSTDDFTRPEFTLRIQSTLQTVQYTPETIGAMLQPSYEHLLHQMMTAVEQPDFCAQARLAGPAFVAGGFTWKHVVKKLVRVLFPGS
jgi:glycosyltransferase involved in cell wall biosynthesis